MEFCFSDQASNRGGIATFLPGTGLLSQEGTAIDLSAFTTSSYYFRFGTKDNFSFHEAITYLKHIWIYTTSFLDPTQSITPVL